MSRASIGLCLFGVICLFGCVGGGVEGARAELAQRDGGVDEVEGSSVVSDSPNNLTKMLRRVPMVTDRCNGITDEDDCSMQQF
jgi:hypothetical protein